MNQPTLDLQDPQTREVITEVVIDLIQNNRELMNDILLEAMEDIALGIAIEEGRQNNFVDESEIFAILDGEWKLDPKQQRQIP